MKVAQELKEAYIPRQVGFAEPPKHPQIGLQQRKEALRPILLHVPTRILLLRMIDELVDVARQRSITAGRVCIEPTASVHGEVGGFLHRLDREITGRLDDDSPLATDPSDDGRPVFVIMAPTGLALLPATTRAAPQRFLPTLLRLALVSSGMIKVVGFDRPLQLPLHLIGQGRIA